MPQDAFTLRYLCEELNLIFSGGKINKITQPSNDQLILTVYTGKKTEKLLLDVNPASPRIGVIKQDKESPLTAPNFCMLMRKHLLSSTIKSIELVGFDRIVKIVFLSSGEFFDATEKVVYVELMGRYSNVILTEDGKILGGNRGINMFDNGVRPLIVGRPYVFPPVGNKKLPNDIDLLHVFNACEKDKITECILSNVQGVAVSTAKEIEQGYNEKFNGTVDGKTLFDYVNFYLYETPKQPCVISEEKQVKDVCVYPYKNVDGNVEKFDFLYLAEQSFFERKEKLKTFVSKRERLTSITSSAVKKVKKKLSAITAKERDALCAEENRLKGELILANVYKFKGGESDCLLDNYYDGSQVKILLDSRLSASKNAENYYKKYNKQKRTLIALAPQKEQAEKELDYLNSVLDEISLSEDIEELILIQTELENYGLVNSPKVTDKKKKNLSFCREYLVLGFKVRAGRNNAENDKLTFTSQPNDVWVHAKDYHSSHVVIESLGKIVPEKVIIIASEICAYYSKGRDGGKTEVVYTLRKHVKKPPKSKPGFCTYDNFKSVTVCPEKHTEFLKSTQND